MSTVSEIEKITLINAKTFSQKLSLSKRQIFRLHSSGRIPAPLRIGGSLRWNEAEITAWIIAGCPARLEWEQLKQAGKE